MLYVSRKTGLWINNNNNNNTIYNMAIVTIRGPGLSLNVSMGYTTLLTHSLVIAQLRNGKSQNGYEHLTHKPL